jgi:histidinol-phosphate aminotransferase
VTDVDLMHHGDAEAEPGLLDFATNVRLAGPPAWLRERLLAALDSLGSYPSPEKARAAVAGRHGRPPEEALLTAGGADAFRLLAYSYRPACAVCVHPSFTEPEAALRAAGHRVERVVLEPPFTLDPALVPDEADLVVLGNPTNPTSVLHPLETLEALARPGRLLVVDEAFADCVPGEPASVAMRRDLPGLVVVRSLTKTWGIAGLRVGYVLAEAAIVARIARLQQAWPVSALAAVAAEACSEERAVAEANAWANELTGQRRRLVEALRRLPQVEVTPDPAASFLLVRTPAGDALRAGLRRRSVAVRRGDTFPGLGPDWTRVAVRDDARNRELVRAVAETLASLPEEVEQLEAAVR